MHAALSFKLFVSKKKTVVFLSLYYMYLNLSPTKEDKEQRTLNMNRKVNNNWQLVYIEKKG